MKRKEVYATTGTRLRVRVFGSYWAVVFYDLGNVWQDVDDFGDALGRIYGLVADLEFHVFLGRHGSPCGLWFESGHRQ